MMILRSSFHAKRNLQIVELSMEKMFVITFAANTNDEH